MHNPLAMGLGDRPGHDLDQAGRHGARPGRAVEQLIEPAAGQILQLEVGQAFHLANVIDLHDVGMPQPGDGPRLGAKPREGRGTGVHPRQNHLERTQTIRARPCAR